MALGTSACLHTSSWCRTSGSMDGRHQMTNTLKQNAAVLAAKMKVCSCPECHGNPVADTYFCQGRQLCCKGTGKVAWFKTLRENCPCQEWINLVPVNLFSWLELGGCGYCWNDGIRKGCQGDDCGSCDGLGYILVEDLATLLKAWREQGWEYEAEVIDGKVKWCFYTTIHAKWGELTGDDDEETAYAAAVKAVKALEGK